MWRFSLGQSLLVDGSQLSRSIFNCFVSIISASMFIGVLSCTGESDIENRSPLSVSIPIEYPLEMWDQGIEGHCILKVRVTNSGDVDSVIILESSGHIAFDSSAIQGAKAMKFSPARRNGENIEGWAQVPVRFSKEQEP